MLITTGMKNKAVRRHRAGITSETIRTIRIPTPLSLLVCLSGLLGFGMPLADAAEPKPPTAADEADAKPIKIGLIGLDTSHVSAYLKLLNDLSRPEHIPGGRIVVGFKGGSPDVESSAKRVDGFTK